MNQLSPSDSEHFSRLEKVIESGKKTFVSVGLALEEIRQEKLYRKEYSTFEEYCQKRWGWNAQRGRQLINSALVVESLEEKIGTMVPISERAARALSSVPESSRQSVFASAYTNGPVTAKTITEAARKVPPLGDIRMDSIGRLIPEAIVADWDRATETGNHLRSLASEIKVTVERALKDRDLIFAEILNPTISEASALHYGLSQVVPHAVCPDCQGRNRERCQLCRKRGFISKYLWNSPSVSAQTRAIIEKGVKK